MSWSDHSPLIPILVLGFRSKLSVGHTQTIHTYLIPPYICGWSWRGCQFSVTDCWLQSIVLVDLKSSSSSSCKISFCLFLTCIYLIYWMNVHWYWNVSLGVIENCMWAISKPEIWICFPCRFVEGRDESAGCVVAVFIINWLTGFKSIIQGYYFWLLFILVL